MHSKYKIIGTYKGKKEVLDVVNTRSEAQKLKIEYQMAYGANWIIEVKKVQGYFKNSR